MLSGLFACYPYSAAGWWSHGHTHITAGAIGHLPEPLQGFFAEHGSVLSERSANEPAGSHWIHMDDYPSFFTGEFPRRYDDVVALHGESFVRSQGTAPWTYVEYGELLSTGMAAAEDVDDWIDLFGLAAAQAHFIEDLHNPFHLTKNYNGQYSGNNGIHARYEGEMVVRHLDDLTFSPADAEFLPSPLDFVFDGIDLHFPYLDDILAADDLYSGSPTGEYYDGMWSETGAFTKSLFQRASEAVANSWYTAWINAGSPTTFLPSNGEGDFNNDGLVDAVDYAVWRDTRNSIVTLPGDGADGDASGVIDSADFAIWKNQFGAGGSIPAASSLQVTVPEPATLGLLGMTLALLTSFRRSFHDIAAPSQLYSFDKLPKATGR